MATAFEQWQAKQSGSAPKAELTAFQKWELEQKKKKEQADAAKATAAPAPASSAGVLSALERQRRLAEGIPLDPVAPDNPLATSKVASGWERLPNIAVQGVNESVAGAVGLGGVAVDTALNIPRKAAAVALPRSAYESMYGTAPETPFTAATETGAEIAGGLRATVEDAYPMPQQNRNFQRDMQERGSTFTGALGAAWDNPVGAAQEVIKQGVTTATLGRVTGLPAALAVMEGGAPEQAGAAFDAEWQKGIPQQSAAYQDLAEKLGHEEARRVLRAQRMQLSSQMQAAAGVLGGKLSDRLGGQELEKALAGQVAERLGAKGVVKQTVFEGAEEIPVAVAGNIASQWTGNPEQGSLEGAGGAFGAGLVMGGGQSVAVAGAQAAAEYAHLPPAAKGAATAREKLQNAGAYADSSKPSAVKIDPKINEQVGENGEWDITYDGSGKPTYTLRPSSGKDKSFKKPPPIVPPVGGATTPPATTQKAPVAPPTKPQKVSNEASLAAAVRLAADLKADPTLGVPEADRPKTLIERKAAYEAIEQRKAEAAAIKKKLPSIVKGVAKAATVQSDSPFDVTGSTNRIIGNLTKSIPAETPVQSLVRSAQAQTRRDVQAPVAAVEAPVAAPAQVAETPLARAGRVIDERRSALEQASRQDRLDEGTVKKLQREEEELRLTLQEDERRKAAGVIQTPEVPYLSEREITSISEKRGELREQLEKHRAAVGYGNQLNDLDTSLSKLGDSDNEVIALATKLQTPTQPKAATAPLAPSAPVANQVPSVQSIPLSEASTTTIEATKALEEPIRVTQPEQQSQESFAPAQEAPVPKQEAPATLPATPVAPTAVEAPVALPAQPQVATSTQAAPTNDAAFPAQGVPASYGGATNARAAMLAVGGAEVKGSDSETRRTANEVKNSPNVQGTKFVTLTSADAVKDGSLLRGVKPDGTVYAKNGTYDSDSNTVYVLDTAPAEVAVHEVVHAATVKAIAAVEQGVVTDPESVLALENLKAVTTRLGELTEADFPGVDPNVVKRIQYAARNPQEVAAILRSSPEAVQALRDSKVVVDVKADKRVKIPVKMPILKAWINNLAALIGKQVFPTKHREEVRRVVERMMVGAAGIQASRVLENTDVRAVKMGDVLAGNRAARQTGTDAKRGQVTTANDAPDASQETPLSKGKGIKARLTNLVPTPIKKAALARGTASQETADMVGSMRGMGNLINHTLASDLQALREAGAKELGKRLFEAEGTQNALVKYFSGDTSVSLPTGIKKVVDKIRAGVDSLSFKLAALGVLTPEKLGALVANFGKYVHRSYKAWDMKPGEWADLVRSSRGVEAKTVAEELFTKVKDEMLDWIAIPDNATLDALYAKATDKDNADGARAAITKLNTMLFNHVPAIDRQDKSSAATVKEQIDALKKARDGYAADPNKAVENAERLMQKLLDPRSVDLNDDRTSNFYKLFAVDAGATKTRQEVPNWLQTVWGKNEEFDAVAIATVHAITDMVAKHSKINEYKERLIAAGVVRTPEQGGAFGYSKLDSGNRLMDYGSLEGHYIKDEDRPILEVLGAKGAADAAALFFGGETANAVWKGVEDIAATTKIMGVTLNFSSMMVNAISSIGVISGALVQPVQTAKNIGKSIGLARREALNVVPLVPWLNTPMKDQDAEFAADLKQAFEADYLGDVAIAQDLRSELKQQVLDEAYKGAPKIKRATEAVKRGFRDTKDTGSRFSAFGDSVGKMLNWYNRIPQLQKAHPELTHAQVKALALEHAKASMPSYTRSAPLARLISRRAVLVGAFATFNSEMFRTAYNDVQRGVEYLRKGATDNNPAAAWYGTQQLMMAGMKTSFIGGMWKVAGLSVSAMGALVASIGDDDDEEKKAEVQQYKDANDAFRDPEMREALKLVVPDYMRGDVFPIRKVDADNWTVGTLARFDPMGLNNALVAVQKGADAYAAGYAVIEGLIGPSIIGEDAVKLAGALGTDPDRAKEAAGSMLRSALIPGTVRQVARNFSDTMRNMDEGQARELLTTIFPLPKNETALTGFEKALGWSGLTATPVNIPEEVVRKLSRLGADVNKQQRKATETLNDTVESDQEFWAQAAVIDATAAETFKKARAIVQAADKLGYDSNYIVDAADKYSAPLEDDMLYGAIEGKLYLPDLYKTLDGWYDRKVKLVEKDPAKLAQLNERYMRLQKEVTARNKARIAVAKQEGIDAI